MFFKLQKTIGFHIGLHLLWMKGIINEFKHPCHSIYSLKICKDQFKIYIHLIIHKITILATYRSTIIKKIQMK